MGLLHSITLLLGLKGWHIRRLVLEERALAVEFRDTAGRPVCPRCGSRRLYRHGRARRRRVLHTWVRRIKVFLILDRHRWRCRQCGYCFTPGNELVRPHARLTRQAEQEALWCTRGKSFSQAGSELGLSYSRLRRIQERRAADHIAGLLLEEGDIHLGIDEHSFRHQDMVYTVTDVKGKRMIGILENDRIATLRAFLREVPQERVKEVCIDMKASLMKLVHEVFPLARLVLDPFHVIADANRRVDEARRIEQEVRQKKESIPKWPLLKGSEKLTFRQREKRDRILARYPALSDFYWAKEKLREMYRLETGEQAARLLDLIIFNLRAADDGELIRWSNTLKRWKEPILGHFISRTTNAYTEGCHTKIKMLKRTSYGLRNVEVYRRKMLLAFTPPPASFHTL